MNAFQVMEALGWAAAIPVGCYVVVGVGFALGDLLNRPAWERAFWRLVRKVRRLARRPGRAVEAAREAEERAA